jgi:response regulator of citrate/malate metabolism
VRKRDFLIVEDSPAVCILLKEFLNKVGIEKIHFCNNGRSGIEKFKELVELDIVPIVFLDYNLPDMNAFSVMTQMVNIRPDIKVILETALDKDDQKIKDLIAQGAYQYLSKPIRYENLKETIETLEAEENILNKESDDKTDEVEKLIHRNTRISFAKISEFLNIGKEEFLPIISKLTAEEKVLQVNDIREVACKNCNSVKIVQVFYCPTCNGSNFKQSNLIEHYNCGNVSEAISYKDDFCPKCRKKIKILGSDYRVLENFYSCNDCKENFPDITSNFLCLRCSNRFPIEQAKWEITPCYQIVK